MKKRGFSQTKSPLRARTGDAPVAVSPEAPPAIRMSSRFGPSILIPLYFMLITVGYLLFHAGWATVTGNELSGPRSLFAAMNAATLTGFAQPLNVNDYTPIGQGITLALTVAGILFSLIAGGMAVVRITKMAYSDGRVVAGAVGMLIVAGAVGGIFTIGGTAFSGVFQGISAVGNSGLYAGRLPDASGVWTHAFLLPLAVLGGLGLPVLMELLDFARNKRKLSAHSETVLAWTSGVYLCSLLLIFMLQLPAFNSSGPVWRSALATASCEAINARSSGFAFQFATYWPRVIQWLTIGLMLIGAAPGGTGGGLKVTTLAILTRGTEDSLRGDNAGRSFGIAMLWLAIYIAMLAVAFLSLLASDPQIPADRLLFLATSALGNAGLSHDPVVASETGLCILSATMLVGRVAPVIMLWWIVGAVPEMNIALS